VWCLSHPLAFRRSAPLCVELCDIQTLTTPSPTPPPRSVLKNPRNFPQRLETEMAQDKTRFQCGAKLAKKVDKENGFASDNEILFRG
jgi:hypothetical protein